MPGWEAGRIGGALGLSLALAAIAGGVRAQVVGPTLADHNAAPARTEPAQRFKLTPFVAHPDAPSPGFGVVANAGNRAINLTQPTTWSVSPDASVSSTQLGLGWRGRSLSAVVGYVRPGAGAQPDVNFANDHTPSFRPRGMVGFGLGLRFR
jgi:hypothetical protein